MDFAKARELMVEQQVRPWDVLDGRVLHTLLAVPREEFVPDAQRNLAYADVELPLGNGHFNHKPVFDGRALQSLLVQADEDVLEIGTGSAYLTACLSQLARSVVSIDQDADLAAAARQKLSRLHFDNVQILNQDALQYAPERQFDVVCVNAAVAELPQAFLRWLKPNGRMFFVRGEAPAMQACVLRKDGHGDGYKISTIFETEIPYLTGAAPVAAFNL